MGKKKEKDSDSYLEVSLFNLERNTSNCYMAHAYYSYTATYWFVIICIKFQIKHACGPLQSWYKYICKIAVKAGWNWKLDTSQLLSALLPKKKKKFKKRKQENDYELISLLLCSDKKMVSYYQTLRFVHVWFLDTAKMQQLSLDSLILLLTINLSTYSCCCKEKCTLIPVWPIPKTYWITEQQKIKKIK